MLSGKDGDEKAYCKQCKASFNVTHGGAYDMRRHFRSTGHNKAVESTKNTTRLQAFGFGESRVANAAGISKKNRNCRYSAPKLSL